MPYDGTRYPKNETAKILLKAADYIREHGWVQGGLGVGPNGEVCAIQAIKAVCNINRYKMLADVADDARMELVEHLGLSEPNIPDWNDKPERTKEEVIAALEGAAIMVESEMVE